MTEGWGVGSVWGARRMRAASSVAGALARPRYRLPPCQISRRSGRVASSNSRPSLPAGAGIGGWAAVAAGGAGVMMLWRDGFWPEANWACKRFHHSREGCTRAHVVQPSAAVHVRPRGCGGRRRPANVPRRSPERLRTIGCVQTCLLTRTCGPPSAEQRTAFQSCPTRESAGRPLRALRVRICPEEAPLDSPGTRRTRGALDRSRLPVRRALRPARPAWGRVQAASLPPRGRRGPQAWPWTSTRSWRRLGRARTARCTRRATRPAASWWR
jgi:hypothetical protein